MGSAICCGYWAHDGVGLHWSNRILRTVGVLHVNLLFNPNMDRQSDDGTRQHPIEPRLKMSEALDVLSLAQLIVCPANACHVSDGMAVRRDSRCRAGTGCGSWEAPRKPFEP
jgi:hypothetical protein